MELTISTPFQQALDIVEQLPAEDQETLVDIIQRRLIEQRRARDGAQRPSDDSGTSGGTGKLRYRG